jgi:hypothetical protein
VQQSKNEEGRRVESAHTSWQKGVLKVGWQQFLVLGIGQFPYSYVKNHFLFKST